MESTGGGRAIERADSFFREVTQGERLGLMELAGAAGAGASKAAPPKQKKKGKGGGAASKPVMKAQASDAPATSPDSRPLDC